VSLLLGSGSSNISAVVWDRAYLVEIWYASSFVPSETWDITMPEKKNKFVTVSPQLGKSIWHHNSVVDRLIGIIVGRPAQSHMLITLNRSKAKPWVEFQYGRRLFSTTGSSNISAVDWDIWFIFGMQIVFYLPKYVTSQNRKIGSKFATVRPPHGRHFGKSVASRPIRIKFGKSVQDHMSMTTNSSESKPEV